EANRHSLDSSIPQGPPARPTPGGAGASLFCAPEVLSGPPMVLNGLLTSALDASRVLVMVLAGGEGKRLGPLTLERAKPAVPFGGRYRIIDIVLSNFVNSGLTRIKVLTQYKSASLEEHVARAWRLSPMLDNFIETIPAQQRTGK